MFLHVPSLTNSLTMRVAMLLTERTNVNAHDDGYDTVREYMEQIVTEFVEIAERRAYTVGRFSYVHNDTLGDEMTDIVLRELHKQSKIDGVVDITEKAKKLCGTLATVFESEWPYRSFH